MIKVNNPTNIIAHPSPAWIKIKAGTLPASANQNRPSQPCCCSDEYDFSRGREDKMGEIKNPSLRWLGRKGCVGDAGFGLSAP
jgi:hypothetical protein